MPILTTPNQVKNGVMWCDDADEVTQTGLDSLGADWDTVLPVETILGIVGLGNGLLALGAPLPRYKLKARAIEVTYLEKLYDIAVELAQRHGFMIHPDTKQWLGNPKREISCLAHAKIWIDATLSAPNVGVENLARGMTFIYAADKDITLRNVMGTRHVATAQRLLDGEKESHATINELKDYLRKELENV